jgi:hypothetical protein
MSALPSRKVQQKSAFLPPFAHVRSRLVAAFHWLSIGWRPLARFATPAGDSDWFESEPYRRSGFIRHEVGLDYVSCSPFRLPIARLAAAQAALGKRVGSEG